MRLHRTYGPGLKDLTAGGSQTLFGVRSQPAASSDPSMAATTVNPDGTWTVNDVNMNVSAWETFPLGVVSGLQYNNNTFGKCFFSVMDTVKFADYLTQDINSFVTDGDFYSILVYQPIRFASNVLSVYE
jgi:hypothetical protein